MEELSSGPGKSGSGACACSRCGCVRGRRWAGLAAAAACPPGTGRLAEYPDLDVFSPCLGVGRLESGAERSEQVRTWLSTTKPGLRSFFSLYRVCDRELCCCGKCGAHSAPPKLRVSSQDGKAGVSVKRLNRSHARIFLLAVSRGYLPGIRHHRTLLPSLLVLLSNMSRLSNVSSSYFAPPPLPFLSISVLKVDNSMADVCLRSDWLKTL